MPNVIEKSVIFLLEYAHVLYNKILTLRNKQINHPSFRFKEVCFQLTPNSIKIIISDGFGRFRFICKYHFGIFPFPEEDLKLLWTRGVNH